MSDIGRDSPISSSFFRTRTTRSAGAEEHRRREAGATCGAKRPDTWRGNRLVLEIDHINGDRLDNRPKNLRYLCPSCHSQTETFSKRRNVTQ
ncbi:HNH endonuclease [Streptomyces sp. NPDC059218]|uniref:HNH endonuclease n=1 Tax=unclassified Streptomyces TaxID=2593676 RepID=UPI00367E3D80